MTHDIVGRHGAGKAASEVRHRRLAEQVTGVDDGDPWTGGRTLHCVCVDRREGSRIEGHGWDPTSTAGSSASRESNAVLSFNQDRQLVEDHLGLESLCHRHTEFPLMVHAGHGGGSVVEGTLAFEVPEVSHLRWFEVHRTSGAESVPAVVQLVESTERSRECHRTSYQVAHLLRLLSTSLSAPALSPRSCRWTP